MILIITYPLITSIILSIYGNKVGNKGSKIITMINIIIILIIMIRYIERNIKYNEIIKIKIEWINIGINNIKYDILIDKYTILMIFLIIIISSIVIIYSFWYMEEDNNRNKFIIYMILFTVSMLIFVIAYNYLFMFIGWEYVGIISFILINYWYINNNNNKSAFKALILNKIGDLSYMVFIYYFINKSNDLYINNQFLFNINSYIIFFLLFAAIAKSAQIFFHVWLGDAMAGPTPVSALLHAATMVTAGIYLLIRLELYEDNILIIIISILTIIIGGISAINQYDIKKIIAYSTVSQIGYMLYGIGINNKEIAIYHLITHGFFKALLFLSAGIIIHNYYNEQDIRKYGNYIYYYPFTYILFIYGSLSIISFPYFSGYYSKEPLIFNSYFNNLFILLFINIGVLLTILYSYNLLYNLFYKHNKIFPIKESYSSFFLFIPLLLGSLFIGYYLYSYIIDISFIPLFYSNYIPSYYHTLSISLLLLGIVLIYIYTNIYPNRLHIIYNRRFFIDSIYNYISYHFLYTSYIYLYKYIDKGILEYIGPTGLYRLLYNIKNKFIYQNQLINSFYLFIIIFFFISFFFIFYY